MEQPGITFELDKAKKLLVFQNLGDKKQEYLSIADAKN